MCLVLLFWFLILLLHLLSNLFFNTVILNSENSCRSKYSRPILCCLVSAVLCWFLITTVHPLQIHGVKTRFFLPLLSQDTLGCLGKDLGFVLSHPGQAHAFLKFLGLVNHKPSVFDGDLNYSTLDQLYVHSCRGKLLLYLCTLLTIGLFEK